ncbi:MAG: DUF6427 family protein [Salegentibacter sp.]
MLTSFFGKSKPLNLIVVILFMTAFFVAANFHEGFDEISLTGFFEILGVLLVFVLSILVLNFIARKNDLTKRSAYKILFFAVFSCSFIALLKNQQAILANLFLLFALRRIVSLRSHKFMQRKIFDATFWICIASLFYFWAILFVVVVYAGIMAYAARLKNWLIPPVAFLCVAAITTSFHIVAYDAFYTLPQWFQASNFDFSLYREPQILVPLSIILALLLWTLLYYASIIQKASVTQRPLLHLILLSLFTNITIAVFSPHKDGSELIFFFVPLSIIASNYFDSKRDKIFREVLLAILILMPFAIPFIF